MDDMLDLGPVWDEHIFLRPLSGRILLPSPTSYFDTLGKPYIPEAGGVFEEVSERGGARGAPHNSAVQADVHDLGRVGALFIEDVECVLEGLVEVGRAVHAAAPESGVVDF